MSQISLARARVVYPHVCMSLGFPPSVLLHHKLTILAVSWNCRNRTTELYTLRPHCRSTNNGFYISLNEVCVMYL